ncbi:MAG: hypothetical protein EYC70_07735 [Planctomycetota bacterium]|nr:MAG: hypothetical protein EYC70_07735 [Planctomycetota bacterium]
MSLNRRQLPNLITLSRLLFAAVVFFFLESLVRREDPSVQQRAAFWAFWFYLAASLTDSLDGWLARKYGWVTAVGRVADPVVDKVLTLGAFIYLVQVDWLTDRARYPADWRWVSGQHDLLPDLVPAWAVVVLLAREFLVTALRGLVESRGLQFPADRYGKAKMTLQTIYICILVGAVGAVPEALHLRWLYAAREPALVAALFWIVIGLTLFSGLNYCLRAARMLAQDAP